MKYLKLFDHVTQDWFDKNQSFYLSSVAKKDSSNKDKSSLDLDIVKFFENIKPSDLEYTLNEISYRGKETRSKFKNEILNNIFHLSVSDYDKECQVVLNFREISYSKKYNYNKFLELFLNNLDSKNKSINLYSQAIDDLDYNLLDNLKKSYILYYKTSYSSNGIIMTNELENYKEALRSTRNWKYKILYYRRGSKTKKYTDVEAKEINQAREYLKKISYEDITFSTKNRHFFFISIRGFEDKHKLISNPFFGLENDRYKIYFGKLRNRYHVDGFGLSSLIQGIGLGFKIYKAFLKYQGYLVSDMQSSAPARKIYYNLMKEPDVYYVVDKESRSGEGTYGMDSQKILLIWKKFNRLEKLVSIIRKTDINMKRNYEYDPELKQKFNNLFK